MNTTTLSGKERAMTSSDHRTKGRQKVTGKEVGADCRGRDGRAAQIVR